MIHPRVLVLALARINAADPANNGLLLRNIFANWPRSELAQIFSSGDNGDSGFFGSYYRLTASDRRFGRMFYRLKGTGFDAPWTSAGAIPPRSAGARRRLLQQIRRRLVVHGDLYEAIFRIRASASMLRWVRNFKPDIIFSQGYNLTFAWLPMMLHRELGVPLAYYPTDDWPNDFYRTQHRSPAGRFLHRMATVAAGELARTATVRVAFNIPMQEEYRSRYEVPFSILMHGDSFERFRAVQPERRAGVDITWIVTTGAFDEHRNPLLLDLDRACAILAARGIRAQVTVFAVNNIAQLQSQLPALRYTQLQECPSHDELAAVLQGADVLFLPERFDETSNSIRLSVSSKAHLFMFSGVPTIVYSSQVTGIAQYADSDNWGVLIDRRDPALLAGAVEALSTDAELRNRIVLQAHNVALRNHHLPTIQTSFETLIRNAVTEPQSQ